MTTPTDNRQTPEQASHDESRREAFDRYMRTTGWGGIPADAFRDAVLACLHPPTIPPNHRVEAANDAYTLASPVETPATVPVPLELAREIVDRDFSVRRHLESDHPHARLYDTLAAGVKEADRGK